MAGAIEKVSPAELDALACPLTESEAALLIGACRDYIGPEIAMLARRLAFERGGLRELAAAQRRALERGR